MSNKKKQANARNGKEMKKRYLIDTLFQLETLKWVFLSCVLLVFGCFRHLKYLLLIALVLDLLQTKYLCNLKWFKYLKYLMNTLIIFLFILNLNMKSPETIFSSLLYVLIVIISIVVDFSIYIEKV